MATEWRQMMTKTVISALSKTSLADLLSGLDDDDAPEVLKHHFFFALATLRRFAEFGTLFQHFPRRFCLLQDHRFADEVLMEMRSKWQLLTEFEEASENASSKYPLNLVHTVRWHAYREIMTFAEECN